MTLPSSLTHPGPILRVETAYLQVIVHDRIHPKARVKLAGIRHAAIPRRVRIWLDRSVYDQLREEAVLSITVLHESDLVRP